MIKKIVLINFKGIKYAEFTFLEFVNIICGKNGTGKTTLADAWYWFWTDKDYELQGNPEIHPDFMAESEPTVIIVWDTGKQEVIMQKVQTDIRTKKQKQEGAPVRVSNKYEINSVPKSQKDFATDVKNMGIDIDNILLYTHPEYLLMQTVANRRTIIFAMAGDITSLDVAETVPDCAEARELLKKGYKDDEITAMKKVEVKRSNEQLEAIPNQIIGMERSKVSVDPSLSVRKDELEKTIANKTEERENCLAQSNTDYYDQLILQLENDKQAEYNKANTDRLVKLSAARTEADKAYDAIQDAKRELSKVNMTGTNLNEGFRRQQIIKAEYLHKLNDVKAKEFECDTVCPTCGQPIPAERIEEAKAKWSKQQEEKIRDINASINAAQAHLDSYKKEGAELAVSKKEKEQAVQECRDAYEKAQKETEKYSEPVRPDCSEIDRKINDLRLQRNEVAEYGRRANELLAEINAAKTEYASTVRQMAQIDNNERIDMEIASMQEKLTDYAQTKANAENILYQMQLISQRKNELLSDAVNSHFTRVKWRLFVTLKNGEIKDDCTPMVLCSDGKYREMTYSANTAAIQAAKLDICRGLQKFYGQSLPIWLDGAECFDEKNREALRSMDAQLILLCVTEDERLVIK